MVFRAKDLKVEQPEVKFDLNAFEILKIQLTAMTVAAEQVTKGIVEATKRMEHATRELNKATSALERAKSRKTR